MEIDKIQATTSVGLLFLAMVFSWTLPAYGANDRNAGTKLPKPIACVDIRTLRQLAPKLTYMTNPRTGDLIDYLVIGDAAVRKDVIVMFPGTGGILPDWPVQMITNRKFSPKIVDTLGYQKSEDGPISLCHDYTLVMFDYPGVGQSPLTGNVTLDDISNDVDAMLNEIATTYNISTDKVDPMGWSLGSVAAIKYAFVSPTSNPNREIGNLLLVATKPGGNTDGFFDGNEAGCVSTIFEYLKSNPDLKRSVKKRLDQDQFELTFPYVGQTPNTAATPFCAATISDKGKATLNVKLNCPGNSECARNFKVEEANRTNSPWSATGGVDYNLFVQQRELAVDYSQCYCTTRGPNFTSTDCHCAGMADGEAVPEMSASNGGICQVNSTVSPGAPNAPVLTSCVPLNISGKINVINGPEDLFIQYVYGQALVTAYQTMFGSNAATIATYPGSDGAGHGVLATSDVDAAAVVQCAQSIEFRPSNSSCIRACGGR